MVAQSELPDAIREMVRDCQRRRFYGQMMINFVEGKVGTVVVEETHKPHEIIERYARPGGQARVVVRTPRGSAGRS